MFNFFLGFILSFFILGFVEAVIKPAATYWTKKSLVKFTPLVLDAVDKAFPSFFQSQSTIDLDYFVRNTFSQITGEDWTQVNLDYFWKLYDPRVTLTKYTQSNIIT
jgi:hypothetical protein